MKHIMKRRSTVADWGAVLRSPLPLGLAALLAVQLIAALALSWGGRGALVPTAADTPLLSFDPKSIQVLRIDGKGDTGESAVVLNRGAQGWVLADLGDFPAEGTKVEEILNKLSNLKRPMPVATSEESLKRHKVADADYERRVVLESDGKPVATLLLGDSPGPRRQLARPAGDPAVYDLDLALYDVGNRPDDWLAKDKLRVDQESIEGIAAKDWELAKGKDGWRFVGADAGKAPDSAAVINLLGRIANLGYRGVLGTQDMPEYNQSAPTMELRLRLKNGDTHTYRISKPKDSQDYVLKASDRPWYFKVAEFDLEGVIDQDRAKLSGETAKPAVEGKPGEAAKGGEPVEAPEGAEAVPTTPSTAADQATEGEDPKPAVTQTPTPPTDGTEAPTTAPPPPAEGAAPAGPAAEVAPTETAPGAAAPEAADPSPAPQ